MTPEEAAQDIKMWSNATIVDEMLAHIKGRSIISEETRNAMIESLCARLIRSEVEHKASKESTNIYFEEVTSWKNLALTLEKNNQLLRKQLEKQSD